MEFRNFEVENRSRAETRSISVLLKVKDKLNELRLLQYYISLQVENRNLHANIRKCTYKSGQVAVER